jgi:hypothetical protein
MTHAMAEGFDQARRRTEGPDSGDQSRRMRSVERERRQAFPTVIVVGQGAATDVDARFREFRSHPRPVRTRGSKTGRGED